MRPFNALVIACCAALYASQAHASLVISLRFNDTGTGGTQTMDVSGQAPGNTVVIQVWATVTGTNTTNTDDGFNSSFFGMRSGGATASLTGNITTGSAAPPFSFVLANGGQIGTFADRNSDGIGDWGGTSTTGNSIQWAKAGHATTQLMAGGLDGHANVADPTHAWDFHIADGIFTIGSISLPGSGTLSALNFDPYLFLPTGLDASGTAFWLEDGVQLSPLPLGARKIQAGNSVTLTLTALPEPGSVALAGAGLVGVAGYAWRRRRMTTRDRGPRHQAGDPFQGGSSRDHSMHWLSLAARHSALHRRMPAW